MFIPRSSCDESVCKRLERMLFTMANISLCMKTAFVNSTFYERNPLVICSKLYCLLPPSSSLPSLLSCAFGKRKRVQRKRHKAIVRMPIDEQTQTHTHTRTQTHRHSIHPVVFGSIAKVEQWVSGVSDIHANLWSGFHNIHRARS